MLYVVLSMCSISLLIFFTITSLQLLIMDERLLLILCPSHRAYFRYTRQILSLFWPTTSLIRAREYVVIIAWLHA
jgi:hypothetical protein